MTAMISHAPTDRSFPSLRKLALTRIPGAADEIPMARLQRTGSVSTVRKMTILGFSAWLLTALPHFLSHSLPDHPGWLLLYLLFGVLFWLFIRSHTGTVASLTLILTQTLVALTLVAVDTHDGFQSVLLVIIAAQLGSDYKPVLAIPWVIVQSTLLTLILIQKVPVREGVVTMSAYLTFQVFATFATHVASSEAQARLALARAHAELRAATQLLEATSRTAERLRIARDLHDLIGHHLTALSLNLEVASHLAEGPAREQQIDQTKRLTKVLLNDVRDVVSRMREDEPLDLYEALQPVQQSVQRPVIHLDMPRNLIVRDASVSLAALRCVQEIVTNAVRHSGAEHLRIRISCDTQALRIDSRDDGRGTVAIRSGNGLRGMRERVEALRGTLEIDSARGHGFGVRVMIPLHEDGR